MKVILTGSTGFIGHEILEQCLASPSITSVVALSRRELPETLSSHSKLTVRIMEDFMSYPEPVIKDIEGAGACIWALGKPVMNDLAAARKVHIEYTISALNAIKEVAAKNHEFRFVYCSGAASERDQSKSLWFMGDTRRMRGELESEFISYGENNKDWVETYIARPAMVLRRGFTPWGMILGYGPSIKVDVLAGVMLHVAVNGGEKQILENGEMNAYL